MEASLAADRSIWWRRTALFAVALLIARLGYLYWLPLGLIHDEAYYWDWSRQLDWGYYSKPPGVAWIIAASTYWNSTHEFFVRLPAALLATLSLLTVYGLAAALYDPKAGFLAAVLTALTPGNAVMSVVMTIDAPFMFCWSLALYCFWRMLVNDQQRPWWVLATTVAVGTGLLCKQTMLAFPVLALAYVVTRAEYRQELRRPTFWLAGLGSLLFLTPVLWWNSQHGWITLAHTQSHFTAESISVTEHLRDAAESWAGQIALISPSTWLLLAMLFLGSWRWRPVTAGEQFLLTFSAAPLALVLLLSLKQRVEPNWPAPFYVAGIVLLGGVASRAAQAGRESSFRLPRRGLAWAICVGLVATSMTYGIPYAVSLLGWKGSKIDPVVRMWGWPEIGAQVAARLRQLDPDKEAIVAVVNDRAATSELAFYLPGQPRVQLWNSSDTIGSQYDLWGLPTDALGKNVLVVSKSAELDPRLRQAFRQVDVVPAARVAIGNGRELAFYLYFGRRLAAWPRSDAPRR